MRVLPKRGLTLILILSLVLCTFPCGLAASAAPAAPTVTAAEESLVVSGFEDGATLTLYKVVGGALVQTQTNVTGPEYIFTNVVPDLGGYYVIQTAGGSNSTNSSFVNSILRTPSISGGAGYVDVGNIYAGATVSLYLSDSTPVSGITPTAEPGGILRYSGLTAGSYYYAMQTFNGVVSGATGFVGVSAAAPAAPTVTEAEESLVVSGYQSGATLTLYKVVGGAMVQTQTNVTGPEYTFTNVVPDSGQYYVIQTVGSSDSANSSFVNSILRTPSISGGAGYVDVGNIYTGATVSLYLSDGTPVSGVTPTLEAGGILRYSGLSAGSYYYAVQAINGTVSGATSFAGVSAVLPPAPSVTAAKESIVVSGFSSGATLKLYMVTGGTLMQTQTNVTGTEYTFANVAPNVNQYYVTQTVGGVESLNSPFVNSILRTPSISAGVGYIDVGNIYTGATVTLYKPDATPVSLTPTAVSGGILRFNGLAGDSSYYAVQSINSVVSGASTIATVQSAAKTITVIETPAGIDASKVSVVPVGDAFDSSIEVRLQSGTDSVESIRAALNQANATGLIFFPLEINIYEKGTNTKVQPKDGTSVVISFPIPAEFLTYKDKLVAACVINGKLQTLSTKIKEIDGVWYIEFTAQHFSPYALVVDPNGTLTGSSTSGSTGGTADTSTKTSSSPKTGDSGFTLFAAGLAGLLGSGLMILFLLLQRKNKKA